MDSAESFFARQGFEAFDRGQIPELVAHAPEFMNRCRYAALMRVTLPVLKRGRKCARAGEERHPVLINGQRCLPMGVFRRVSHQC
jgi:hypothetical protein